MYFMLLPKSRLMNSRCLCCITRVRAVKTQQDGTTFQESQEKPETRLPNRAISPRASLSPVTRHGQFRGAVPSTANMVVTNDGQVFYPEPSGAGYAPVGYCGLLVRADPPHEVSGVSEIMDFKGLGQEAPGYSNEKIELGDRLAKIDGKDVQTMGAVELKRHLDGAYKSVVELAMLRKKGSVPYTVRILRGHLQEPAKSVGNDDEFGFKESAGTKAGVKGWAARTASTLLEDLYKR
jgi:hypothetical protein